MTGLAEHRITLNLPGDLWRRLEAYWHGKAMPSRNDAIRLLLETHPDMSAVRAISAEPVPTRRAAR